MKSFTALSFLAVAAVARADSSSATATSTASPLIPTGISSGCSSFLDTLNSNSALTSCITPIVNATSAFGPLGSSSSNITTSDVSSALDALCSTTTDCSDSTIRSQLTSFYSACSDELTGSSPNADVIRIYDVLYTLSPLKTAACAKDDSGNYCVPKITSGSSTATASASAESASFSSSSKSALGQSMYELVQNNLWQYGTSLTKRATVTLNTTIALVPNTTTFRSSNLVFLFLTPDLSYNDLCVSCTRSVLSAYITFEQSTPYALGIANSPILGGQPDLYSAVTSTCGSSFMSGAVQAAGGLSDGLISGAAPRVSAEGGFFTAAAAAVLGLAAFL